MQMKRLLTIAALVCVAAPVALAGPAAQDPASTACKAERKALGMDAFRSKYAAAGKPKAAFEACVAQQPQVAGTQLKNASKACKAERGTTQATRDAFAEKYGTNANNKNAFGKCVSMKAKAKATTG
jgi:hypothetical protein